MKLAAKHSNSNMHDYTVRADFGMYVVRVSPRTRYGYFEHTEHGDLRGGGLWFDGLEVTDYDGVAILPVDVIEGLTRAGYDCAGVA